MPYAIVSLNQRLYDKSQANVTAWSNVQEDSSWLQEFADAIRESANDNWDNVMVTDWFLDNITVSFVEGDHISYSVDVEFTLGNLQGNELGGGMPGGSALLISTSFTGARPNRGRIYFSGLPEDRQSDGFWTTATKNTLRSLVQEWRDGLNVAGINTSLQIARRPSDVYPSYVFNPVQFVTGTEAVRSQRRRNPDTP